MYVLELSSRRTKFLLAVAHMRPCVHMTMCKGTNISYRQEGDLPRCIWNAYHTVYLPMDEDLKEATTTTDGTETALLLLVASRTGMVVGECGAARQPFKVRSKLGPGPKWVWDWCIGGGMIGICGGSQMAPRRRRRRPGAAPKALELRRDRGAVGKPSSPRQI